MADVASSVKALVCDVFGTVVDWRGSIADEGQQRWAAKAPRVDWAAFAEAWRSLYHPSMQRVRSGALPWTNLDGLHRMMLEETLVTFGVTGLTEAGKADLNKVWHRLHGWPDSAPGLLRLKQRFIISALSNGNLALLTNMARFAGLPWDCILASDIFRHYKPDPEVYLGAADMLGLEPYQVMMVAAHANDLHAARALGLATGYVYRPLEQGPDRAVERVPDGTFGYHADSFLDLAAQLGT
ncbi:MAG: haloacid dehalogenase type II [Chloroflexota bacterium]